jgi:hypothetical protein
MIAYGKNLEQFIFGSACNIEIDFLLTILSKELTSHLEKMEN